MEEGPKTVEKGHVFPAETKTEESWFLESVGELEMFPKKQGEGGRHHLNAQAMVNKTREVFVF